MIVARQPAEVNGLADGGSRRSTRPRILKVPNARQQGCQTQVTSAGSGGLSEVAALSDGRHDGHPLWVSAEHGAGQARSLAAAWVAPLGTVALSGLVRRVVVVPGIDFLRRRSICRRRRLACGFLASPCCPPVAVADCCARLLKISRPVRSLVGPHELGATCGGNEVSLLAGESATRH